MCWQVYAAVGMKALGLWQENKARAQVAKSQAEDATLSMNYQLMNYEQARADAYDEVVGEIIKTRQNSMQLNSQVNAAVAEEMEAVDVQQTRYGEVQQVIQPVLSSPYKIITEERAMK